jgi:hypothetical protein
VEKRLRAGGPSQSLARRRRRRAAAAAAAPARDLAAARSKSESEFKLGPAVTVHRDCRADLKNLKVDSEAPGLSDSESAAQSVPDRD